MWTRELAKRLLLPRADVEGLEDLLDTYFMLVRPFSCCKHLTDEFLPWHEISDTVGTFAAAGWMFQESPAMQHNAWRPIL